MGDQAVTTDEGEDFPRISDNLPPIRPFTGSKHHHDAFGMLDYIRQVEEHTGYVQKASSAAQENAKLSDYKSNLEGIALTYLTQLIDSEKSNW